MKTGELLNGYFIEQKKPDDFVLQKKYEGMRKGQAMECVRPEGHFSKFTDAAERFLRLLQYENLDNAVVSLPEYINAIKAVNTQALQAIYACRMELQCADECCNEKKGNEEYPIVALIPKGHANAIKRPDLVALCVKNGLVNKKLSATGRDRATRKLIEVAKRSNAIINLGDRKGYFIVCDADIPLLERYVCANDKKAKSIFRGNIYAKKLLADYKAGRL